MARRDLTVKQRKWLKLYVKLGNATEAAMQVYDCKDREIAASVGCENLTKLKGKYTEVMEAAGIDDAFLAKVLRDGLEATSVTRGQKDGKFCDEQVDVDYQARHRYLDTAHKLRGDHAASKHEISGPDGGPMVTTAQLINQFTKGNGRKSEEDDDGAPDGEATE